VSKCRGFIVSSKDGTVIPVEDALVFLTHTGSLPENALPGVDALACIEAVLHTASYAALRERFVCLAKYLPDEMYTTINMRLGG